MSDHGAATRTLEAIWKIESPTLIAGLVRATRDIGLAEEAAHEAMVAALEQWPRDGIPDNPAAWLATAAKRKAIDRLRRDRRMADMLPDLARSAPAPTPHADLAAVDDKLDGGVQDDLLRLIFATCHPALTPDARSALTLKLLCGLNTAEIARCFLVPEPTIAQRIVRAKRTLADLQTQFEIPSGPELVDRVQAVLEVVYLLFNEGYSATAGDDWMRPALCEEALRLGRILAELMPDEPEVHGLVALMEIQASRQAARTDAAGDPILLMNQDRSRWDRMLIRRGLASIDRARRLGHARGPYTLQALIASRHAIALTPEATDWPAIISFYDELASLTGSPIVELNRAVAISMFHGPQAGLDALDHVAADPAFDRYHPYFGVRGDLLLKLNRPDLAREAFERAAALCANAREKSLFQRLIQTCNASAARSPSIPRP